MIKLVSYYFYSLYIIFMIYTFIIYFNYNFNLDSVDYYKKLVKLYSNSTNSYKITHVMSFQNGSKEYPIEYIQEFLGSLSMIVIAYYRAVSVLVIAPFPAMFKALLVSLISIPIRIICLNIIDLFGSNSKIFNVGGYTLENLFYLYDLSIKYMLITVLLIPVFIVGEYYLSNYINKIKVSKADVCFLELPSKIISFSYVMKVYKNLKICFIYFKF